MTLETERLTLRPILGDPEVMAAWEHGFSDEQITDFIKKQTARLRDDGVSYLAVIEKESGALVGLIGLLYMQTDGQRLLGLGYILRRDRWGGGLAAEGARGCIAYARDVLGACALYADIRPQNTRSRRLAEALGMAEIGETRKIYEGKEMPHILYRLAL